MTSLKRRKKRVFTKIIFVCLIWLKSEKKFKDNISSAEMRLRQKSDQNLESQFCLSPSFAAIKITFLSTNWKTTKVLEAQLAEVEKYTKLFIKSCQRSQLFYRLFLSNLFELKSMQRLKRISLRSRLQKKKFLSWPSVSAKVQRHTIFESSSEEHYQKLVILFYWNKESRENELKCFDFIVLK